MNSKNIISNKFDLNWSTTFSYTGVQQFFRNPAPCTMFLRKGAICINYQHIHLPMFKKWRKENDAQCNQLPKHKDNTQHMHLKWQRKGNDF